MGETAKEIIKGKGKEEDFAKVKYDLFILKE
jgi:hypothetical protein